MKIRKELDRDKLLSLCKFLESVLTDNEISELAGMLLGGLIAKVFKGEKRNERRKN
jgi:serine/threonine-protein kinase RIO1